MVTEAPPRIDGDRLVAFLDKVVGEFGAIMSGATVVLGEKLGLYRAMADSRPVTPSELARRTATDSRLIREWLVSQAAGGYVEYDPVARTFVLPPEHAVAFTDESSPACVIGGYLLVTSLVRDEPHIREVFRTGKGFPWGEHHADLFEGTEKFFRPGYLGNLVDGWLPAVDGAITKLERGATVADVGCGHGASTIIMARAFPNSRFFGFDDHAPSIAAAREAAAAAGVAGRVTFEVASAQAFPGDAYDLVAFFDCLHDMGDPVGALKRTADALSADGSVLIVEPMAGQDVEDNLNPVGRIFASASVLVCTPHALATGNTHLGTTATDSQLREVAAAAGLSRFRRATETPFNRVFEAKL